MKCFDNRETADVNPYETRLEYPTQIRKELEIWFKMHNIPKNEPIKLKVSQDTNYTQVSDLLEALKRLGGHEISISDYLKEHPTLRV